jgi:hypothetical protein
MGVNGKLTKEKRKPTHLVEVDIETLELERVVTLVNTLAVNACGKKNVSGKREKDGGKKARTVLLSDGLPVEQKAAVSTYGRKGSKREGTNQNLVPIF